jgi:hypothetical protein
MTVVLEDQVRAITTEIIDRFGSGCFRMARREDSVILFVDEIVRAVVAQYDISTIARLEVPSETLKPYINSDPPAHFHDGKIVDCPICKMAVLSA